MVAKEPVAQNMELKELNPNQAVCREAQGTMIDSGIETGGAFERGCSVVQSLRQREEHMKNMGNSDTLVDIIKGKSSA